MISFLLPFVKDVVSTLLLSTMKGTIYGSTFLLSQFMEKDDPQIIHLRDQLEALDLDHDLQCIHAFIQTIEQTYPTLLQYPPLHVSLQNVQGMMKQIHDILWICNDKMQQHQLKWFSKYRTLMLTRELTMLEEKQRILKNRFAWLEKTLQLCLSLQQVHTQQQSTMQVGPSVSVYEILGPSEGEQPPEEEEHHDNPV